MSHTPIHNAWMQMIERCSRPSNHKWPQYGGRGVKVCDRWRDFANFYADMGPRPEGMTLERVDVNGDYCPENCRWATQKEQQRNRRNNVLVEFNGERRCLAEWAEALGMRQHTLAWRLRAGWSVLRAFTEPVR